MTPHDKSGGREMSEKLDAMFGKDAADYIRQQMAEIERLRAERDELLAALKACVSDLGGGNPELNWPSLPAARDAIAKAEGGK
jgi:hypothetical protein